MGNHQKFRDTRKQKSFWRLFYATQQNSSFYQMEFTC